MSNSDFLLRHYEDAMLPRIEAGHPFPYSEYVKSTGCRCEAHERYKHMIGRHVMTKTCVADTPVVICFDVSGCMMGCPQAMLRNAVKFRNMIGSLPVEIAYAAHGGAVPLQFSDFSRRNVICSDLMDMYLDGGDDMGMSSTLAAWYLANSVETHAWGSAGKRGYLFLVENKGPRVVQRVDAVAVFARCDRIYPADAFMAAMDRWDVYALVMSGYESRSHGTKRGYGQLVGETRVIPFESADNVPAIISSIICKREGVVAKHELRRRLASAGFEDEVIDEAVKAVKNVQHRLAPPKSYVEID